MKIYNQNKTQILENIDLDKGYLIEDRIIVKTIPEQPEIAEQYHYEYKEYANGGRDRIKVVDIEKVPYRPERHEYEDIKVYVPYSNQQLIKILKEKLRKTDYQAIKHFEGYLTNYEYEPIKAQRQAWRDEINELEKLI